MKPSRIFWQSHLFMIVVAAMILTGCGFDPPDISETDGTELPIDTNSAPTADAGLDRTILITDASNIIIDGSGSSDPNGDNLNYTWTCLGPDVDLSKADLTAPSFTVNLISAGSYYFILVVDDGVLKSSPSIITIAVLPPDGWVDDDFNIDNPDAFEFRTVQGAIDFLGPNKLIVIMPGVYNEYITVAPGVHLFGLVESTDEMPKIISSVEADDDTLSVVRLNSGAILENLVISCTTSPAEELFASIVQVTEGSKDVVIQNCRIQTASGYDNSYVDGIAIHKNSGVLIAGGTSVEDISGEGIVAYQNSDLVIENSRLGRSLGSVIYTIESGIASFYNLVIHHAGSDGFDLTSRTIEINHCTVAYFNRDGIRINSSVDLSLRNSLVFSDKTNPSYYAGVISRETVDVSNLPNKNPGSDADPLFVNGDLGYFELLPGSIAIGGGEDGTDVGATGDILLPLDLNT